MRADMLGPDCDRLWIAYLAAERDAIKTERNAALAAFIALAKQQSEKQQAAFARTWCAANLDGAQWSGHRRGAPMRFPLLSDIVGPALLRGRAEGVPGCARWLARLWGVLDRGEWRDRLSGIGGPDVLLDEALAINADDEPARAARVRGLMSSLDYGLHELPWIIEDQAALQADLDRLEALGPLPGQDRQAFDRYVLAVGAILDGNGGDTAADEYNEAHRALRGFE